MKKTLLYLIIPMLFATVSVNAQIKVWDFGAASDASIGAGFTNQITAAMINNSFYTTVASPGISTANIVGNLSYTLLGKISWAAGGSERIRSNNINIARYDENITAAPTTYTSTPDYVGRLYGNGLGDGATKHTLKLNLTAGDKITVFLMSDATGGSTNGTYNVVAPTAGDSFVSTLPVATSYVLHINATTTGEYLLYDTTSKMSIYRVYDANVSNAGLGFNDFKEDPTATIYTSGKQVYVSNVKSNTQVDVFSMNGSLVKSLKTENDTDFDLKTGVYIVNAKSADGEKSVKVIVK